MIHGEESQYLISTYIEEVFMNKRAARRQRSRERRIQESRPARRRQLIGKMAWATGLAVVLLGVVVGGIFYAGSLNPGEPELSPSTGVEIGNKVGNHLPEFDLRLVDGSRVNSAELVSMDKPVFYFFFATW